ncbi:MAG: RHS repeat domain-containing protein [Lachnospiraceae bacterium]
MRQSIGFTGYLSDEEAGTSYAKAREYLPQIGRFAAEDVYGGSIAVPYSQNRYSYCYNNPLVLVDGDGRKPTWKSIQEELDELGDKAKKGVSNVIRGFEENFWRKNIYGEDILLDSGEINGKPYEVNGHRGADVIVAKKSKEGKFQEWYINIGNSENKGISGKLSGRSWKPSAWRYEGYFMKIEDKDKYVKSEIKSGIFLIMKILE